jgi:hypothetical protein
MTDHDDDDASGQRPNLGFGSIKSPKKQVPVKVIVGDDNDDDRQNKTFTKEKPRLDLKSLMMASLPTGKEYITELIR